MQFFPNLLIFSFFFHFVSVLCRESDPVLRRTKDLSPIDLVVLDFPPKSPDLNPIENNWEIMDATNPENTTELLFSIERAFDYIKTDGHEMLINTLNSMPRRFDIVVEKKEKVVIISHLKPFSQFLHFDVFGLLVS